MTDEIKGGRDLLGFYADDGYDFIGQAGRLGWRAIPSWGSDGWDLGDWPIVVYLFRETAGRYERARYIEGDITITTFGSREERDRDTDAEAFHWWQAQGADWVDGIYSADEMPDRLRGRFTASRLEEASG